MNMCISLHSCLLTIELCVPVYIPMQIDSGCNFGGFLEIKFHVLQLSH